MQPALKKNQAFKENVTGLFSKRLCFKMTVDGAVSGSLFDSRSLCFCFIAYEEEGVRRGERAAGRLECLMTPASLQPCGEFGPTPDRHGEIPPRAWPA